MKSLGNAIMNTIQIISWQMHFERDFILASHLVFNFQTSKEITVYINRTIPGKQCDKVGRWALFPTTFEAAQSFNTPTCLPGTLMKIKENNRRLRMDPIAQMKLSAILWDTLGYSVSLTSARLSEQISFVCPALYLSALNGCST